MIYTLYQNTVCVEGGLLYKDQDPVMKLSDYRNLINRYATTLRTGGNGRTALIDFNTIPKRFRDAIINRYGDPFKKNVTEFITSQLKPDTSAFDYFSTFKLPDGRNLPEPTQREYFINAQILNLCEETVNKQKNRQRVFGKSRITDTWKQLAAAITELDPHLYPHTLPSNPRSLARRCKKYMSDGYASLVHKNFGNGHAVKIEGDVADWILATYMLPNKVSIPLLHNTYLKLNKSNGWPSLSESAIALWLDKPEIRRIWKLSRDGKEAWVKEFQHHTKRDRSKWFPNAYWAMDGTKLDWLHQEDNSIRMAAKLKMNVIIDVFSEKILGWSFSETEDHTDHFKAIKMAFNQSQSKPYYLTYDNQSGHKSSRMQELYSNAVAKEGGTHHPHKAYAKNNPIEQVFNRFQQQCVNQWWFSDGQGIKVRRDDNKPNMDFIMNNRDFLKDRETLESAFKITVDKWNNATHPHFEALTRSEVYDQPAPMSEAFTFLDQVGLFWITNPKQVTYKRGGMIMTVAKQEYEYEVYDEDNKIDSNFRVKYTGAKLSVKYDPEDMEIIRLYIKRPDGKLEYVANAQIKRGHETIPALMQEGQKAAWYEDYETRNTELEAVEKRIASIQAKTGINPEKLIENQNLLIKMGGLIPKDIRNEVESDDFLSRM